MGGDGGSTVYDRSQGCNVEDEGNSVLQVLGERGNICIIEVRKLAD